MVEELEVFGDCVKDKAPMRTDSDVHNYTEY